MKRLLLVLALALALIPAPAAAGFSVTYTLPNGNTVYDVALTDSMSIRVGEGVTYVRPRFDGLRGPLFAFSFPDIQPCFEPAEVSGHNAPFRITYGDTPEPWPVSHRVESNDIGFKLIGYKVRALWLRVELYDETVGAYTEVSPWFYLNTTPPPPAPPERRTPKQEIIR